MRGVLAACAAVALVLGGASPAVAGELSPASFDPGPPEYPNVARQADVPIPMRDGVTLYADVYRPADARGRPVPGRFPVVLNQILFNKHVGPAMHDSELARVEDVMSGYSPLFVRHGYVQVIVDARGTGSSQGEWTLFGDAERDTLDVARWLVRQPFSDGRFVGWGSSCMAIHQLFMAGHRPPGLKALFAIVPTEDLYRDALWHGGAFNAPFFAVWHGLVSALNPHPPMYAADHPHDAATTLSTRPQSAAGAHEAIRRPYHGDYYDQRSPGRVAERIEVPSFVVGGWYSLLQRGTPRIYDALDMPPGEKQLLIGPWYHATTGEGLGEPGAPPPLDVLALAWFDRWVKGERNGIEDYGPVTVQQLGSDRWERYRDYPRNDTRYERFYLSGERSGSAAESLNDGSLTTEPPATAGSDSMPGNTPNGACTRSTTQWSVSVVPPGQPCETGNRSHDATSLTYTTEPLDEPLHLSGPLSLTLNGSTTARDATWVATVDDVAPDGTSSQITAGWLLQSRRALDVDRTTFAPNGDPIVPFHPFTRASVLDVEPGAIDTMAIEIFNTDAVIRPGHRLRVTIAPGDVPHLVPPPDSARRAAGGVSTVHHGGASPSFLTAAVAPLGPEP